MRYQLSKWNLPQRVRHGLSVVLLVICLPVLIGFAALCLDAAYIYLTWGRLQITADSCALAGAAWMLERSDPTDPSTLFFSADSEAQARAQDESMAVSSSHSSATRSPQQEPSSGGFSPASVQAVSSSSPAMTTASSSPLPGGRSSGELQPRLSATPLRRGGPST